MDDELQIFLGGGVAGLLFGMFFMMILTEAITPARITQDTADLVCQELYGEGTEWVNVWDEGLTQFVCENKEAVRVEPEKPRVRLETKEE